MPYHGRVWFCVECHDERHEECLGEDGDACECWCREEPRNKKVNEDAKPGA